MSFESGKDDNKKRYRNAITCLGTINGYNASIISRIQSIINGVNILDNKAKIIELMSNIITNHQKLYNYLDHNNPSEIKEYNSIRQHILQTLNVDPNHALKEFHDYTQTLEELLTQKLDRFINTHINPITAHAATIHPPILRQVFHPYYYFHEGVPNTTASFVFPRYHCDSHTDRLWT